MMQHSKNSADIRHAIVTAQLEKMLPTTLTLLEISLCAQELIKQIDMFKDSLLSYNNYYIN
mgnify:FL=1|tara:strand:- start:780 stop:962 length:183 start_codon:yes stop_codon:yes gene_type:complete